MGSCCEKQDTNAGVEVGGKDQQSKNFVSYNNGNQGRQTREQRQNQQGMNQGYIPENMKEQKVQETD